MFPWRPCSPRCVLQMAKHTLPVDAQCCLCLCCLLSLRSLDAGRGNYLSIYIYIYKKPLNGRFDDEIIQSIEKEGAWQHLFLTLFHEKFSALWVKMPGIKKGAVFLLRIFNGSSRLCSGGHGARSLHSWCSAPDV